MTAARHRSAAAATSRPDGPALRGRAPGGLWWIAWRQHRLQVAIVLVLIAVVIAALIAFREVVIATFTAAGCDLAAQQCQAPNGSDVWSTNGFSRWYGLLDAVVLLAPIVLGVFVGAPIFTREFSRGTHVFALTQSVGRLRWWAVKISVAGVPLVAGLLVLGFVTGWVDGTTGYTANGALGTNQFATRAIIPAAHGLIAFAIAVAAGILTRSTVASLVTGFIVAGLAVVGMVFVQPNVLTTSRQVTPIDAAIGGNATPSLREMDPNIRWAGGGYLDADGNEMPGTSLYSCFGQASDAGNKAVGIDHSDAGAASTTGGAVAAVSPQERQAQSSPKYQAAFNQAMIDCARSKGIAAEYQDYLPGSLLWPLRWAMTGIAAVLAALFLLLSATRLRAAAAKR